MASSHEPHATEPLWKRPRLEGLTFCFTGDFSKDPAHRPKYKEEPLTQDLLAEIIQQEGGTLLPEIQPGLHYLLRLGQNYPPTLRREVDDMNEQAGTRILQYELDTFFLELLWPSRVEFLEMLRSGKAGAARFSELIEYAPGGRRVDIRGIDLHGLDLEGVNFRNTELSSIDLRGAKLKGARLPSASKLLLDGADLSGASIRRFTDSSLKGARLDGITRCHLLRCDLSEATLVGANIQACTESNFQGATLDESEWAFLIKLENNNFDGARLRKTRFNYASFSGSSLRGADLRRTTFYKTNLEGLDLRDADCREARFEFANLSGAQIAGANFTGASLRRTEMEGCELTAAVGLEDARVVPAGQIGPAIRKLADVCADSQNLTFKGCAETPTQRIEFELHYNMRRPNSPAMGQWRLYDREPVDADPVFIHLLNGKQASIYPEYIMDIAGYWPDATVQWKSIRVSGSKAPLKGADLKRVVLEALAEAWGQEPS